MRVQTYGIWVHHPAPPCGVGTAGRLGDDITSFIDDLITRVAYYPSFTIQITPDADGLLVEGAQRVVQADEQPDGMVVLRTRNGTVWITHAAYHRLVS